jgi:hypothetical protein
MRVIEIFFFTPIQAANILISDSSFVTRCLLGVRQNNGARLPPKTCSSTGAPSPAFKNKDALNGDHSLL